MATDTITKKLPAWKQPVGESKLLVYNSLTRCKVPLIPKNGNTLNWYICGPTVYDVSHLGHARTYLSFDIIRRILQDYFKYHVNFVMNITDIDDKIIIRARERGIPFTELARSCEISFMEDMKALKVLPSDVITRVTEYVPQVIAYVAKIIENGYGYVSNGSVYFDTMKFASEHSYPKLVPTAAQDTALLGEGEGSLSVGLADKKAPNDFVLWKKSKEGEPTWESPWGLGRPGWHIECSAMASDILGDTLDIHSGGEDLRFPHHDNELAQSEAFFGSDQWVNYFIHSGHLHIEHLKMSKSLKNFISIKEALSKYTPRQLRIFFLLHKYDSIMDYSDEGLQQAKDHEKTFVEFFHTVKAILRDLSQNPNAEQDWKTNEKSLHKSLEVARQRVHEALLDNFNTPEAVSALAELVHKTHLYIKQQTEVHSTPRSYLLNAVAEYITNIFKVFGVIDQHDLGFPSGTEANVEQVLTPFLDAITQFREQVRTAAKQKDFGKVLAASDKLRDETLPSLGVRLDDINDKSIWKLEDKQELLKELEQKKKQEEAKALEKAKKEELRLQQEKERLEKSKVNPADMGSQQKTPQGLN